MSSAALSYDLSVGSLFADLPEHSYVWVFIAALVVSFADAWGIGSNDVANSFATSVGAKTLTIGQAVCIALFTEFIGAAALGSNTTSTVRNGIIELSLFDGRLDTLMLAMLCASVGSAIWVNLASMIGAPVSTTHATVGGIMGAGIAAFGLDAINWDIEKGLPSILLSFVVSPVVAGLFASTYFLFTKYAILIYSNSKQRALYTLPLYAGLTAFIAVFSFVRKGSPKLALHKKAAWIQILIIGGATTLVVALSAFPGIKIMKKMIEKWEEDREEYISTLYLEEDAAGSSASANKEPTKLETLAAEADPENFNGQPSTLISNQHVDEHIYFKKLSEKITEHERLVSKYEEQDGLMAKIAFTLTTRDGLFHLLNKTVFSDLVADDYSEYKKGLDKKIALASKVKLYDPSTEKIFDLYQILSAAFASFAHGSNDVANAIATFSTIYTIYSRGGSKVDSKVDVPIWILVYGAIGINMGLLFRGRKVLRVIGNGITYQSPSRGFSTAMGAVSAVILATFLALPVSTTHCISGATIFVGVVSSRTGYKSVNWLQVLKITSSWLLTLPFAGLVAGLLYYCFTNSPSTTFQGLYYTP